MFWNDGLGKDRVVRYASEELNRAGIPLIVIDPKGDMANLALAFEDLSPEEFTPWVDDSTARANGMSVAQLGAKTAEKWQSGLEEWGITKEEVAAYVHGLDVQILTPGSHSGTPVNVLGALTVPSSAILDDLDAVTELATSTVSGLLSLAGVDASPAVDPSHIVMCQILLDAWQKGEALDLEQFILAIVDPSFERVGVFPVDTFFPKKDRMKLAMRLNGLIAAPSLALGVKGST